MQGPFAWPFKMLRDLFFGQDIPSRNMERNQTALFEDGNKRFGAAKHSAARGKSKVPPNCQQFLRNFETRRFHCPCNWVNPIISMTSHQDSAASKEGSEGSGVHPPAIALPKGGGAIRGIGEKFAANPVTGTGSMTVPIATSPGRSGFGPQLSLSYDSGAGNGAFGFGWSLSLPSITRKTDKGLPRYRDAEESDVYILSGAEDLVPVLQPNGSRFETSAPGYTIHRYRPRIEGLFARIERWTNRATGEIHWRSITRDNITTFYGKTAESRIADPSDPRHVFSWLICESYDDKGNAILYEYKAEDADSVDLGQAHERNRTEQGRAANRYPKRIRYGNRQPNRDAGWGATDPSLLPGAAWMFEVVFDYDEGHCEALPLDPARPELEQHRRVLASASPGQTWSVRLDPFSTHRPGFEVRSYRRCRRVLMFHRFAELGSEPSLVRSTEFEYADLDYAQPTTIEAELAYQGSTRFASFIRTVTQSGFVRDDTQPVLERNGVKWQAFRMKSVSWMPAAWRTCPPVSTAPATSWSILMGKASLES
jgi:hypothetical protein